MEQGKPPSQPGDRGKDASAARDHRSTPPTKPADMQQQAQAVARSTPPEGELGWRGTPPPRKNKALLAVAIAVLAIWLICLGVLAYLSQA